MEIISRKSIFESVRDGEKFVVDANDFAELKKNHIGKPMQAKSFMRDVAKRQRSVNPISANQADIVNWVIYDRVIYAAAATPATKFTFFAVPSGSGGKTNVDTNMTQVKRLEDPQWFNTCGVGFYFRPNILFADLDTFLNEEYMNFWVGQKTYLTGPIQAFPGAAGLTGFGNAAAATSYFVNGTPNPNLYFDVRLPAGLALGSQGTTDGLIGVTILQGQAFWIDCLADGGSTALTAGAGGGTGLTIMAFLYGQLSRGVQ